MIRSLFPRFYGRFVSLPLLGPIVDGFCRWLLERGYLRGSARHQVRSLVSLDRDLRQGGCQHLNELTRDALRACIPEPSRRNATFVGAVRALERYLGEQGNLPFPEPAPLNPAQTRVAAYATYLQDVRGFCASTIAHHCQTASEFLRSVGYDAAPNRLETVASGDIEAFVQSTGSRLGRASLQHTVAHLRGFLRYLAVMGAIRPGLEAQIDTPRLYRLEQLPRALPWKTVCEFLDSIDRSTAMGLRDYTMFFLIASYGLRTSEVVSLTLDHLDWRSAQILLPQRKTRSALTLPLTDGVGTALVEYLRHGRPQLPHREVFLRARAPHGVLKPTAVTDAFQGWSKRSRLGIRFQGPHCLRHSYAVHLLRSGVSMKAIGDILGHRSSDATCVYLRLALEDLREVALSLPSALEERGGGEVTP